MLVGMIIIKNFINRLTQFSIINKKLFVAKQGVNYILNIN